MQGLKTVPITHLVALSANSPLQVISTEDGVLSRLYNSAFKRALLDIYEMYLLVCSNKTLRAIVLQVLHSLSVNPPQLHWSVLHKFAVQVVKRSTLFPAACGKARHSDYILI
jgi:hypothetical protein